MPAVCCYFQVHQPYRLKDLRIRHMDSAHPDYFDDEKNRQIFRKVAEKCYLPTNKLMLDLLNRHPDFHISYSLSGVFLDQCKEYGPDVLASFQALAKTGKVEFLAETYYHSLSAVASIGEFAEQVSMHVRTIEELFGQTPRTFRNTELIFNNEIAQVARLMGFSGIIAEGTDHLLRGRSPNNPFRVPQFRISRHQERAISTQRPLHERSKDITVLLKNYRLSDDIAFRFSDKNWSSHPLSAETYADWVQSNDGHTVNLFMDYETFGEHQWADTGIFQFLEALPRILGERGIPFFTPAQTIDTWKNKHRDLYDVHSTISWADSERDLSAWTGNRIQQSALNAAFALECAIKTSKDPELLGAWRKLLTSDHLYYMSTKYWSDGDVHKYFSPYESPYEAYRRFSHALCDLKERVTVGTASTLKTKQNIKPRTKSRMQAASNKRITNKRNNEITKRRASIS